MTLCGAWDLFKAQGNCVRGCMFFILFMRDACFPPSVTCLKVKFNMLPEKLLVNNLISYVLGIMGVKEYSREFLLYSLELGGCIASIMMQNANRIPFLFKLSFLSTSIKKG